MTGRRASTFSILSQINSPDGYDDRQLTKHPEEIQASGAALIASAMPSGLLFSEVTADIAADVASILWQFTERGVEVWVRFAREMNWCVQAGTYRGNSTESVKAWYAYYNATHNAGASRR